MSQSHKNVPGKEQKNLNITRQKCRHYVMYVWLTELRSVGMLKQEQEEIFVEFEGLWELMPDLPDAIEKDEECGRFTVATRR